MRKEIYITIRKIPKPHLPCVWADLFMGIRTEHSKCLLADMTEEEKIKVMDKIQTEVGIKACWREFLKRNGWTDELFDDWWVSTSEQKLENYLGQNSTNRTEGSSRKSHLPFMLPLAAVLGSFVGNLLVILIFRLLKIS